MQFDHRRAQYEKDLLCGIVLSLLSGIIDF